MESNRDNGSGMNSLGLTDEQMNSSTIFSKPEIEDKKPPKKQKKGFILRVLLAIFLIALLIGLTLFFNKQFGKNSGSSSASSAPETDKSTLVNIISYETDDLKSVEIKNEYGTFDFYYDKHSDEEGKHWYIKGISEEYINSESTELTVGDCANLTALMRRDAEPSFDYGFDTPKAVANVTLESGETYTLTIGKPFKNGNIEGAYAKVSEDESGVYVLDTETSEYLSRETVYYINSTAATAIEKTDSNSEYFGDSLEGFDYITLSGDNVTEDYRFEMYNRDNSSVKYRMTSPAVYNADDDTISNVLSIVSENLETGGVYEFQNGGLSDKLLKEYGLDNPCATLVYKVGKDTVTIKLQQSDTDEKYYAMTVNQDPVIYKVTRLSFDFLEYDCYRFVSSAVLLEDITGIKTVDVSIEGQKYEFGLKTTKSTNEDDEEEYTTTVKFDGKNIDYENFSRYYYYMLAVCPYVSDNSLMTERPEGAEEYVSVTMKHNSATDDDDITMTVFKLKNNKSRYYIELDGTPVGLCEIRFPDLLAANIDEVISNEKIGDTAE